MVKSISLNEFMTDQTVKDLIQRVAKIGREHQNELDLSGERFNIFKLLKVEASEVRLHSTFIAELLNTRGSHGFKNAFLDLFLTQLGITDFDTASASTFVELYIGPINEARNEGGRLDICIKKLRGKGYHY